MGYDKSTQQITELAFYTTGDYFLFKYRVVSPGVWKGEGVGIDHGKPFTERLELRKLGRDSLEWKATDFVLGGRETARPGRGRPAREARCRCGRGS